MVKRQTPPVHPPQPARSRKRRASKVIRVAEIKSVPTRKQLEQEHPYLINDDFRRRKRHRFWRLSFLWFNTLLLVGGSVSIGILWLTKLPPQVDCQNLPPLAADSERLFCVQEAAKSGEMESLVKAMELVASWQSGHPLYPEAQRMLTTWSEEVLEIAREQLSQGEFPTAVTTAEAIPVASPLYPEAQAEIAAWQHQWQLGEELVKEFETALKEQNWQRATQFFARLEELPEKYWQESGKEELMLRLAQEKTAWQQLQDAQKIAKAETTQTWGQALALAAKIAPQTYAHAEAQKSQNVWSRHLLQVASQRVNEGKFAQAVEATLYVPESSDVYSLAQDWLNLSQAFQAAVPRKPLGLVDALAAVSKINSESPIFAKAKQQKSLWQSQLQDSLQIKLARTTASLGVKTGLQLAIAQAKEVNPKQPGRIEAQTWIAQWRKEIAILEDRSILKAAQDLASLGSIEALGGAITIAQQVEQGRPLRIEAQTWIAAWRKEQAILQDRPLLTLAQDLAEQGKLRQAIATVEKIAADRPLYQEAQAAIAEWSTAIKTEQDQQILQTAVKLANQGNFSAAITTAREITPDRPLYRTAQVAIGAWRTKLPEESP